MNATVESTLADIVKQDFRAATVLSGYKLDFCCKGGRPLSEACKAKGLDPNEVLRQIEQELKRNGATDENFTSWSPSLLTRYIEEQHHAYIRSVAPVISGHLTKVARVHGERHPEVVRVAHLFEKLRTDLEEHMAKEELVLFPYIRGLVDGERQRNYPFPSVDIPVRNMMTEHEMAGDDMEEIRMLTGNYSAPEDACTTYRIAYMELEEFEQNLHKHVHLENNILFPRAIEMEKRQRSQASEQSASVL